ncbi:MAG TPA: HlyD family efflux transporter periplasmic adaptor subunit [Allocoleopsis sp.]
MPDSRNSPNPFPPNHDSQNDHSQNGHSRNGNHSSITVIDPASDSASPAFNRSEYREDWSSLTKDTINTMPRVWTRGLLYLLAIFAAIVLPWAMLSKVDQVGTARGQLEPKGKTFKLDAPVTGEVSEIKVKEGQTLKAGQVLVELESNLTAAEIQQAQAKLEGQLNRLSQLEFMRTQLQGVTTQIQRQQGTAEAASQQAAIDETQQKIEHGRELRDLAQKRLDRELQEVERYQKLVDEGIIAEVQLVQVHQAVDDAREALTQADSELRQAESQLAAQQNDSESKTRDHELTLLETSRQTKELESQIADLNSEINQTKKQIEALTFQLQQRQIRSPITGTLFELPIDRPGAVVQVGQEIAQIAPEHVPLVLRANMSSQESGFLAVGMPVKIKFDAYPFQDYGIVEGHVTWVSPDSKLTKTAEGATVPTYELEITLNQPYIQTANKQIALTPGQTATAEVIVRQRRIIDFLLDPFKKLQAGGIKL